MNQEPDGIRPESDATSRLLVLTGDGKGKTTSASGMLLRALGHGQGAFLVRFLKVRPSPEVRLLEGLGCRIAGGGRGFLPDEGTPAWERHAEAAREAWEAFEALLPLAPRPSLVVLDEVCIALGRGLLGAERVRAVLAARPAGVSVVCTGRGAPDWLRELADTVSEVECRRHAWQRGIPATPGIEL